MALLLYKVYWYFFCYKCTNMYHVAYCFPFPPPHTFVLRNKSAPVIMRDMILICAFLMSLPGTSAQKQWFGAFGSSIPGYLEVTPMSDTTFAVVGTRPVVEGILLNDTIWGSKMSLTRLGKGLAQQLDYPLDGTSNNFFNFSGMSINKVTDGYLLSGARLALDGTSDIIVCKVANNGAMAWPDAFLDVPGCRSFDYTSFEGGISVRETADKGVVLLGVTDLIATSKPSRLLRLGPTGDLLWRKSYDHALSSVRPLLDGSLYLMGDSLETAPDGSKNRRLLLLKTTANGSTIFKKHTPIRAGAGYMEPVNVNGTNQGVFLSCQFAFVRADAQGNVLWADSTLPFTPLPAPGDFFDPQLDYTLATGVAVKPDGRCIGVGIVKEAPWSHMFARQYAPDGKVEWTRLFKPFGWENDTIIPAVAVTSDGSVVVTGHRRGGGVFLVKLGEKGSSGMITGTAYQKADGSCAYAPGDQPLVNWLVEATDGAGNAYYASTDAKGEYGIWVPTVGKYKLTLLRPSPLWLTCSPDGIEVELTAAAQSVDNALFAKPQADCPMLSMALGTEGWRKGYVSRMVINYCNNGGQTAANARVELRLPEELSIENAVPPLTAHNPNENSYSIALGDVQPGACGKVNLDVRCAPNSVLSSVLCVEAHIFPDIDCTNNFASALILRDSCSGDSAYFSVTNQGPITLSAGANFVIAVDNIIKDSLSLIALAPGQTQYFSFPAAGGSIVFRGTTSTGLELVSILEGCGGASPSGISYLNQVAQEDGNAFTEKLCAEVRSSFDPNDKSAVPTGLGPEHDIPYGVPLHYTIRFENLGNDTAFTVLVTDTLATGMDIGSFQTGPASHPYQLQVGGEGHTVLRFLFNDIRLPHKAVDSSQNKGFLTYSIRPKDDLPLGFVVKNRAAIYFDFNEAIITNTTAQRLSKNIFSRVLDLPKAWPRLRVFPNPATGRFWIEMPGQPPWTEDAAAVRVFDAQGRMSLRQAWHPGLALDTDGWPPGRFVVCLFDKNGILRATGVVLRP
jgi:hypothetical protein